MFIHARHFATGERLAVEIERERIVSIAPAAGSAADLIAEWIAPSFFDIQVNGAHGISFTSPDLTVAEVQRVAQVVRSHGVGGFCPTVITADFKTILHALRTLAAACAAHRGIEIAMPAFHLEGPYLSPDDGPRGAHPREPIRDPDWDEFQRWQDAAEGRIRLVTLAPERPGALAMIERLTQVGVVAAIGHTAATAEQIRAAIAAGARISTHLGNGAHAVLPRHPNYIWEQLAADELWASVIADGHHLSDCVLKCILRVKSPARTVLISDASGLAGLAPGRYRLGNGEFDVLPEGKTVMAGTRLLAGAAVFLDACVDHVLGRGLASLPETVAMASSNPRRLLGLSPPTSAVIRTARGYLIVDCGEMWS